MEGRGVQREELRGDGMEGGAPVVEGGLETAIDTPARPGATIGPYHLLELIGEGGMGQVWLAEQKLPVRRRVAIKLIKIGMDTREVVARFNSERQALALMDHPAIAKVFDAGSTVEGRPYFVMEYVAGLPITAYCDRHRLSMRQRMELFILVCEGVQHAHQKAIIHRDLKPSNILVTEVDGKPAPRIIDFGVAKATSQQLSAGTMYTRIGSMIGTLGYMSPEQADSGGEDIDTRSDVYSLGAVLYEVLVGALPHDFEKVAFDEVLRRLRDQDAPKPSTRLRTATGEQSAITARNRATEPPTLARQLKGDPDAIVLKALEKDRKRRYASPHEMGADLERYLRNEPVIAHSPGAMYRAKKYVARHRVGVVLASLAVLLLVGFAVAQGVQLRRIRRERDRADRITGFMTEMFKVSNPSPARGNDIRVREVLDKAAAGAAAGLEKDPEVQAEMLQVMGDVYSNLGLYAQAESLTRRALDVRTRTLGRGARDTLESLDSLVMILDSESRYAEAEKAGRESVAAHRKLSGAEDRGTLKATEFLATAIKDEGRYEEAEKLHSDALTAARRRFGDKDPLTIGLAADLAIDFAYEAKYPEAERAFRQVLQMHTDSLGAEDPKTLRAEGNLGAILLQEDRFGEAETTFRDALGKSRRVLGREHPLTLTDMGNLALSLSLQDRFSEAEPLFRETLEIKRRLQGAEHRSSLVTAGNLADVLRSEGKYAEAEALFRQTLAAERRTLGNDHSDTQDSLEGLGEVLAYEGQFAEATKLLQESYNTRRRVLGLEHPDTAESEYGLAGCYALQGKKDEALGALKDAIEHGLRARLDLKLAEDSMMKPLLGDPRFKALAEEARQKAALKTS